MKFISQVNFKKVNEGLEKFDNIVQQTYEEKSPTFEETVIRLLMDILNVLQEVNN